MDPTLPQMSSFDFDRLDPVALEQTLAWFKENPEVPAWEDYEEIGPGDYTGMLEEAGGTGDWLMDRGVEGELPNVVDTARKGDVLFPPSLKPGHGMEPLIPNAVPESVERLLNLVLPCSWEGCENLSDTNECLTTHLESHAVQAFEHWTRLSRCLWQGCQSKVNFKTAWAFKQHIRHIHTHPIICTEAICSNLKPFRDWADLERHKETIHLKLRYPCPYDKCPSGTQTFIRKDKLLKHIRETVHENDAYCFSFHCQAEQLNSASPFTTRKEISAHFGKYHETNPEEAYRCALGSCLNNPTYDFWTAESLADHLRDCHGLLSTYTLVHNCKDAGSREFDVEHFTSQDPNKSYRNYTGPWHDCTICAPQAQAHGGEYSTVQDAEGM